MNALDELMSNINWMIHDLVDGDQIDNEEEERLTDVYKQARAELAALRQERDAAREAIRDAMEYLKETRPERVKYPEYIEFHVYNALAIAIMPERVDGEK